MCHYFGFDDVITLRRNWYAENIICNHEFPLQSFYHPYVVTIVIGRGFSTSLFKFKKSSHPFYAYFGAKIYKGLYWFVMDLTIHDVSQHKDKKQQQKNNIFTCNVPSADAVSKAPLNWAKSFTLLECPVCGSV